MKGKSIAIPIFIGGFFVFIIVTAAGVIFVLGEKNKTLNSAVNSIANTTVVNSTNNTVFTNTPSNNVVSNPTSTVITDSASVYKDGTYSVDATYAAPEEYAPMKVSITLLKDVITSVRVTPQATGESGRYQTRFANAISSYIVGKNIDSAKLANIISGASLTTDAFNEALARIQIQAM